MKVISFIKDQFSGRLNRKYFILSYIVSSVFIFPVYCVIFILQDVLGNPFWLFLMTVPFIIASLAFTTSLLVRRLHDIGISGIFIIVIIFASRAPDLISGGDHPLTPLFNLIALLCLLYFLLLRKGNPNENKYGLPNVHTRVIGALFNIKNKAPTQTAPLP